MIIEDTTRQQKWSFNLMRLQTNGSTADVQADTRKLDSTEAFLRNLTRGGLGNIGGDRSIDLKSFADRLLECR
jgi:hypothetical protein